MLDKIYEFAKQNNIYPYENFKLRDIRGYIILNEKGDFIDLMLKDKDDKEKVLCPDIGSLQFSGKNSNPIVCKLKNIIDIEYIKHIGFVEIMTLASQESDSVKPIVEFLNKLDNDETFRTNVLNKCEELKIKMDSFFSFSVNGLKLEEQEDWKSWFSSYMSNDDNNSDNTNKERLSVLTGEKTILIPEKAAPQINTPIMGTGCYVVSCSNDSFASYGLKENQNNQIGKDEAMYIKGGLEYLLDPNNHHYDNNFNIIHYCDDLQNNIINDILSQKEDEDEYDDEYAKYAALDDSNIDTSLMDDKEEKDKILESAYNSIFDGSTLSDKIVNDNFHIMTIEVPTQGRFYLGHYKYGKIKDLYDNFREWYKDTEIINYIYKQKLFTIRGIKKINGVFYSLSENTIKLDSDKIKKEFGIDRVNLLYSIIDNKQIPKKYYIKALRKIRSSMLNNNNINRIPISIVKCYLIREQKKKGQVTIMSELNKNETNIAYNCGRLFATYEAIQYAALKNVNASIVDKYFASAQSKPSIVFGQLARLSNHHLSKLKQSSKIFWSKQLQEISTNIPNFPKTLSIEEQGMFALGYYHQKNDNFINRKQQDDDAQA